MKKIPSLKSQINRLVLVTIAVFSVTIIMLVLVATLSSTQKKFEHDTVIAVNMLDQIIRQTNEHFFNSALVLTADFGFKQAIATLDLSTMDSVLDNHQRRIGADVMALLDLDAKITSTSHGSIPLNTTFDDRALFEKALNGDGGFSFYKSKESLFSIIAVPIKAPVVIGVALIGYEIDGPFLKKLSALVKQELKIIAYDLGPQLSLNSRRFMSSTLDADLLNTAEFVPYKELSPFKVLDRGTRTYVTESKSVFKSDFLDVQLTLIQPTVKVFSEVFNLLTTLAFIAIIALFTSFAVVLVFSRRISLPLNELIGHAEEISRGQYDGTYEACESTAAEIRRLDEAFAVMRDRVQEREQHIAYQANHDSLTGLLNRQRISEIMQDLLEAKKPHIVYQFKVIELRNIFDTFGYQAGEHFLQEVSKRLLSLGGIGARINGGEFIWIPENEQPTDDAATLSPAASSMSSALVSDDIAVRIGMIYTVDDQELDVRFAISSLNIPDDALTPNLILMRLNIASDVARESSAGVAHYSKDLEEGYLFRLDVLNELKNELASGSPNFQLHFQPKFRVRSLVPEKAEALIRWINPKLGFIPPDVFILIAEQSGLIHEITRWVLIQTIRQQALWLQEGIDIQVAVNLSIYDIEDEKLLGYILEEMKSYGVQKEALSFEVTEGALMKDPQHVIEQLAIFHEFGFALSVDDFGTGYSSLSYLKKLPVEELKIDKEFILKLDADSDDQIIVEIVLKLARRFNLESVAEGVENIETLRLLRDWNCEWAQGFYLSRPIPQQDFALWYQEYNVEDVLAKVSNG